MVPTTPEAMTEAQTGKPVAAKVKVSNVLIHICKQILKPTKYRVNFCDDYDSFFHLL